MRYIQDRRSNEDVWRNTKSNLYWQRKVWAIPIHLLDMQHWVVCVVYIEEGRIFFFDSFAQQTTLRSILPVSSFFDVIMQL